MLLLVSGCGRKQDMQEELVVTPRARRPERVVSPAPAAPPPGQVSTVPLPSTERVSTGQVSTVPLPTMEPLAVQPPSDPQAVPTAFAGSTAEDDRAFAQWDKMHDRVMQALQAIKADIKDPAQRATARTLFEQALADIKSMPMSPTMVEFGFPECATLYRDAIASEIAALNELDVVFSTTPPGSIDTAIAHMEESARLFNRAAATMKSKLDEYKRVHGVVMTTGR
jgi:hypothetical protein